MKVVIGLLRKVRTGLRLPVVFILGALGFVLFVNGITDGAAWTGWVGGVISALVLGIFAYLEVNHTDL